MRGHGGPELPPTARMTRGSPMLGRRRAGGRSWRLDPAFDDDTLSGLFQDATPTCRKYVDTDRTTLTASATIVSDGLTATGPGTIAPSMT